MSGNSQSLTTKYSTISAKNHITLFLSTIINRGVCWLNVELTFENVGRMPLWSRIPGEARAYTCFGVGLIINYH